MLTVFLAGNLGRDATMRDAGQTELCSFSVATERKVKGEKHTTWVDCTIWGARGAALVQYLVKGTKVAVAGELSTREHEGKTYLQCRVDQITLLGSPRAAEGESRGNGGGGGPSASGRGGGSRRDPRDQDADQGYGNYGNDDEIPF